MKRSAVDDAAVAWREARLRACAAPLGNVQVWTDLGAAETALSVAVQDLLEREAAWAAHQALPLAFVVHGMRQFSPYQEGARTLEEAVAIASAASEWGHWWPDEIRSPEGEVILGHDELLERMD